MKRLLIVDDNEEILDLLSDSLEEKDIAIYTAIDGEASKSIILEKKPHLIISDVKMTYMNGIELFNWSKNKSQAKFILMSGFSDIISINEAINLGIHDLIEKPIDINILKSKVNNILIDESDKERQDDNNYFQINLKNFITGKKLALSIFVKLRDEKYIMIAKKGDDYDEKRLLKYIEKPDYLYVLKSEYNSYIGYNKDVLNGLVQSPGVPSNKVNNFISSSLEVIIENFFLHEVSQDIYVSSIDFAYETMKILKSSNEIINLLISMDDHNNDLYDHSLKTGFISLLIAKKIKWNTRTTLHNSFMAGLMHDIGLAGVTQDVFTKHLSEMTKEEEQFYLSHPVRGMEKLNTIKGISPEVTLAAYQHHEDCVGNGFPLMIKKNKINPLSRLVSVADCVKDNLSKDKSSTISNYISTIKKIEQLKKSHYDPVFFTALKDIFGLTFEKLN